MSAQLGDNASGQREELGIAGHLFSDSHNAQRGNAIAIAGINGVYQIRNGALFVRCAQEGLNGHTGGVHADGVVDVHANKLTGHIIGKYSAASGAAKCHRLVEHGGDAGAQSTAGGHKDINVLCQVGNQDVKPLQSGGGTGDVAMVKGQHQRVSALGIENAGETILHAPVHVVHSLYMEVSLAGGNIQVKILFGIDCTGSFLGI